MKRAWMPWTGRFFSTDTKTETEFAMLVLGRQTDQTVVFDVPASDTPTRITVMIVRVQNKGGRVRLGCDAPEWVRIIRGELERKDGEE